MLVNTHVENAPALGLYRSLGFEELGYRLTVLERAVQ
jgi:ribosomal protein S18 acetylase RimI-like enzyme